MDVAVALLMLKQILAPLFAEDEVDFVANENTNELEVMTDDWTLHVDCRPNGLAWLALDTEPESAEEARALRDEVMGRDVVHGLVEIDGRLDGALSVALAASDDLLSTDLVAAMAEVRDKPHG